MNLLYQVRSCKPLILLQELNNPPAEASDKPGKFPRASKQLAHLQKTLGCKG